ncbi:MAG: hypothetical protein R3343_11945 [Nitriliruptorales bacterium]|nr:hypothetical protein [Nitriliruptorales bacterium]
MLFRETQAFRQWWAVAAIGISALIGWWAFLSQIVLSRPFGDDPASDVTIWVVFLLQGLLVPAVWWWLRLETVVTTDALSVRFRPFPARVVDTGDIVDADTMGYRAIRDYGGYGYRRILSGDTAFIVSGDRAVKIDTGDDRDLVVGSQRPVELLAAIEQARGTA